MIQPSVVNDEISYLIVEKKQLKDNQQNILACFRDCKVTQLGSSYGDDENCIDPQCKDLVQRIPFDREKEYLFIITKDNLEKLPPMEDDDNLPHFESKKPKFKEDYDKIKIQYIVRAGNNKPRKSFWQILSKVFT